MTPERAKKALRHLWLTFIELWDSHERWRPTHWLCAFGWHWPVKWDEAAHPGSYDPPHPPEPNFCCQSCGHIREPYRAWWWEWKRLGYLALHGEWSHR